MKKLFFLLITLILSVTVFTACGKEIEIETPPIVALPTVEEPSAPEVEVEPEVIEPVDDEVGPEGYVRSKMTNEWILEADAQTRPIAVQMPNDSTALPHYSISKASIVYEILVEGNISRLQVFIEGWDSLDLDRVGNIRSVRHYFVPNALEWDAFILHFGGPFYADEILAKSTTDNIDGNRAPGKIYYRSTDRKAPQNAYTSTEGINLGIEQYKYSKTHTDRYDANHFIFAPASKPNTLEDAPGVKEAVNINLSECFPVDKPYFEYNPEDHLYYRYQYGKPHVDAAFDNTQLTFTNIIIWEEEMVKLDAKGYLAFGYLDSGKTTSGYFCTEGRYIHITWKKANDFANTRFYDDDGNEIIVNTGKTMMCVIAQGRKPAFK